MAGRSAPGGDGGPPSASHDTGSAATPRRSPERGPAGKPPPLPVEALGPELAAYVRGLAVELQVPTDLVLLMVLGALAAVAQDRLRVEIRPGWVEPCGVYGMGLACSGHLKTALARRVRAPVVEVERQRKTEAHGAVSQARAKREALRVQLERAKRSGEGVEDAFLALDAHSIPPDGSILAPADVTTEALLEALAEAGGALAFIEDEGDVLQIGQRYQQAGPNLGLIKAGHPGEPYRSRRRRNGGERCDLERVVLTYAVLTQPEAARRWVGQPGIQDEGVWARFLVVHPASTIGWRDMDPPPLSPEASKALPRALERLAFPPPSTVLRLDDRAQALLKRWRGDIEVRLRPGGDLCEHASWTSKLPGNLARIAALLAVVNGSRGDLVEAEWLARALSLGDALIPHRQFVMSTFRLSEEERRAEAILDFATGSGFTLREATRSGRTLLADRDRVEATAERLVREGELAVESGGSPKGGPRTRRYRRTPTRETDKTDETGGSVSYGGFAGGSRTPTEDDDGYLEALAHAGPPPEAWS